MVQSTGETVAVLVQSSAGTVAVVVQSSVGTVAVLVQSSVGTVVVAAASPHVLSLAARQPLALAPVNSLAPVSWNSGPQHKPAER